MNFVEQVKNGLLDLIKEMSSVSWLFVKNPGTDFSRKRKLDFENTLWCLLSMESGDLKRELLELFGFRPEAPSASAFNQQRCKILPEAFEFLFHEFNNRFTDKKTYGGYSLIACDGSDLNISRNPKDTDTYFQSLPNDRGFNQLHLNALYDLNNRRFIDAIVQAGKLENESLAMTQLVDRYTGDQKSIFIADRNYETYNIFAHIEQKGMYYLIRVKDGTRGGMVSSFTLPDTDEFDHSISMILTRKQTKAIKESPLPYKFIGKQSPFDYLDLDTNKFYSMTLRVVRFLIAENTYECIVTNLPVTEFPVKKIKELYAMRWGIETSFRELKYAVGLSCFHSKKAEFIQQEIYARLILYNYSELIITSIIISQNNTKHIYQINYTIAIHICRHFLRNDISPPNVEKLIQKHLLPVRPGRSAPRKVRPHSVVCFLYRVA